MAYINPHVRELLQAFLRMANEVKRPYAIGGALALAAHGYVRETHDVDAFVRPSDRLLWLRAAHKQGLTVDRVYGGLHYIAFFVKHGDPRERIDILVPYDEPARTAVRSAKVKTITGSVKARVFTLELLVIEKFLSDRPEDHRDVDAIFDRGYFEPETITILLRTIDPSAVKRWQQYVTKRTPR